MASNKKIVTLICITLVSLVAVGCSDSNSPMTAAPVDTAPPAVPTNLSAEFDQASGAAVLVWDANVTDSDFAGFIVTRESYGVVESLVSTPAQITDYSDASPVMGVSTYSVSAVDQSGNQSAVASVELVRTGAHNPDDLNN